MGELELAGIAARLYALPFDDFVAARTAAAKEVAAAAPDKGSAAKEVAAAAPDKGTAAKEVAAAAPDKGSAAKEQRSLAAEVRSLPKPSVAAWTVNMLAVRQPGTLNELAALGQAMRAAQSALDAAELRRLAQQRRQLLASAVRQAQTVAEQHGRKISGAIATEVEETLRAATADEGAATAARSGRLLRGLSADGVDVVELAGAVALPSITAPAAADVSSTGTSRQAGKDRTTVPEQAAQETKVAPATKQPAQPRLRAVREAPRPAMPSVLERARAAFVDAEESAREAAEDALRYGQELDETTALASELAEAARTLRKQLEQTELDLKSARKRQDLLAAQAQQAARAADRARRKEDLARERVLRLGNTPS